MDEQKATPYQGFRRDLVVAHSTNKGATWHDTSVVYNYLRYQNPYRVDKPWITADCNPSSPYKNSQYVAFTAIYNWGGNALYSILFSYKRPNGKYTNPVQLRTSVGGTQSVFGAFAVVGIDGTIFVFWGLQTSGSSSIIQMVKSTNGGQSFTLPVTIKSGITESLNVISFLKAHSWPYVAVNPVDGSLNMVYGNGGIVLFSYSTDNGVTWSASEHKGMSPTVASWNPNITCDSNGKLAVVYYATGIRVLVATGYATDETFDVWSQGSLYFSNPYKWTDYIGIACNDYTYWAVWPAPSGEMSKIFGTHRTVSPVIENLDQEYLTFTNDKIKFDGSTYASQYNPQDLFPGEEHSLQTYSNTLTKNGSTYNFYRWEDENGNLISTNSLKEDVKIDNHRYRAMFEYVPPPPPQYVTVNIKNEFKDPNNTTSNGGMVNVDEDDYDTDLTSGQYTNTTWINGSRHRFEAKEQIYPEASYYRGFNPYPQFDNGGWRKDNLAIPGGDQPIITPKVQAGTYTAKYRNRYNAYVNGSAPEDNGFIANIFPTKKIWQYESDQISAPPDQTFPGGLNGIFSYWSDGSVQNLRNISPFDNTTYTAVYKYVSRSNNQNAYANNGQRKFVRTNNGILFNLYESINRVWLEKSTDGGSTWVIANQGKPLANYSSKNPSMCLTYADLLYIVFEDDNSSLRLYRYDCEYDVSAEKCIIYSSTYLTDTNPVVTYCFNDYEAPEGPVVIWKSAANDGWGGDPGLYYAAIDVTNWNNYTEGMIPNTNMNSYNPSIAGNDPIHQTTIWKSSPMIFNLVWEQRNGGNSSIIFNQVQRKNNRVMEFSQYQNISDGFGYSKNYNPSIVTIKDGTDNFTARVSWIAYRSIAADGPIEGEPGEGDGPGDPASLGDTKVFYRRNNNQIWSSPSSYGNNINIVNINKNSNNNTFAFAWSEGSSNINKFVKSNDITTVYNTNTTGRYVQVGNYTHLDAMRLNSFTTSTPPYYFTLSNTFNTMPEAEEIEREGLIVQDTTAFYYSLGGITVDDQSIDFIEIPDTVTLSSQEELNSYLVSVAFNLTESSSFIYGVKFGVTDSISAASALAGGKFIQFQVELIEDQTGDVLGTFDDVTFNSENIIRYESNAYQVNLQGIGNKICRLKLKTNSTLNFGYSLIKSYSNEVMLAKRKLQIKSLDELGVVTTYALEQNFPNPFNPSTIIRYQIPNDGIVKLKIFNILGQEIITLVNEEKTVGRYQVNFDASGLASGVYIYKLQAGEYVSSKKMILLK